MPEDKEAPVYTAEKILLKRIRKGKTEYFIKWKGWAAKWNTWEPEKHILDKLLIEDFNNRNRKHQKSKSLIRTSVNKRPKAIKNRTKTTIVRARRLQSSSSSDISTSAIVSPVTNDENNDKDESFLKQKFDNNNRTEVYKLRSKQTEKTETNEKDLSDTSKDSDQEDENVQNKSIVIETPQLDESLKDFLWEPTKSPTTSTTITEVTDQAGVTVLIRQLNDMPASNTSRTPRFLGYGSAGRGGRH